MASDQKKYLRLISSDKEVFEVEEKVIVLSDTVKNLVEEDFTTDQNNGIPLLNVHSSALSKVIEYCKYHHAQDQEEEEENKEKEEEGSDEKGKKEKWDDEFMKSMDINGLFDLVMAANYLSIKNLLDLTTNRVAYLIKDKSVEQVRAIFNIENDFTPKEEDELRKQHAWAFEK